MCRGKGEEGCKMVRVTGNVSAEQDQTLDLLNNFGNRWGGGRA